MRRNCAPDSGRLSRAGLSAVVGALQGVERAPVRSLRKNFALGSSANQIETLRQTGDPTTQKRPSGDDGVRGGPAPTFLAGRATFECTRGPRNGGAVAGLSSRASPEVDDPVASERSTGHHGQGR